MFPATWLAIMAVVVLGACTESTDVDAGVAGSDGGSAGCEYGGKHYRSGDSFDSLDGCNTCGCGAGGVACTARACVDASVRDAGTDASAGLHYFQTCGAPVCGPGSDGPTGAALCTTEAAGAACVDEGALCDPSLGCGINLVCAKRDPAMGPGGCPISRARYKTAIRYLGDTERRQLHDELLDTPLVSFRYAQDVAERDHVGFIIEDIEPSPSVRGDHVDLYGYASMTVAALQVEAARVHELQQELARLHARLQKLERRCAR